VDDVCLAGVGGVVKHVKHVKHPCAGIEEVADSPETKPSPSLMALLRAAYERIRPGATAFTRSRPEKPMLWDRRQTFFRPRSMP
jgi:hypothetical protein